MPKDYQHDVFISYRRNNLIEPWVTNYFLELFQNWLTEHLHALKEKPPRIFFDKINHQPGDPWPARLKQAVKSSKVLLSICSPSYFASEWCISEWESFGERQRMLNRSGLRIPVRHNDCEDFLRGIQWSDFYGYTYLTSGFYQSAQAAIFEKKVEDLALVVARAIKSAPPFDDQWPSILTEPVSPEIPMFRL